mmetsp:Transcript_24124/g.52713  ORF Transcript_24124/g.52713 Transcript_24124/m.52713 type:complete len:207 (+) Transcript_24124:198-818(+)
MMRRFVLALWLCACILCMYCDGSAAAPYSGPCVLDADCAPSQFCNSTTYGSSFGVCSTPNMDMYRDCTRGRQCTGLPMTSPLPICMGPMGCGHGDAVGCANYGEPDDKLCQAGSYCVPQPGPGGFGICFPTLDANETCSRNTQCYSGKCVAGKCTRNYHLSCGAGRNCRAGFFCYKRVCVSRMGPGGPCTHAGQCTSRKCTSKVCA